MQHYPKPMKVGLMTVLAGSFALGIVAFGGISSASAQMQSGDATAQQRLQDYSRGYMHGQRDAANPWKARNWQARSNETFSQALAADARSGRLDGNFSEKWEAGTGPSLNRMPYSEKWGAGAGPVSAPGFWNGYARGRADQQREFNTYFRYPNPDSYGPQVRPDLRRQIFSEKWGAGAGPGARRPYSEKWGAGAGPASAPAFWAGYARGRADQQREFSNSFNYPNPDNYGPQFRSDDRQRTFSEKWGAGAGPGAGLSTAGGSSDAHPTPGTTPSRAFDAGFSQGWSAAVQAYRNSNLDEKIDSRAPDNNPPQTE